MRKTIVAAGPDDLVVFGIRTGNAEINENDRLIHRQAYINPVMVPADPGFVYMEDDKDIT